MSFSNNIKDEIFNNFSTVRKENLLMAEKFGEELTKTSKKENLKEDFENFLEKSLGGKKNRKAPSIGKTCKCLLRNSAPLFSV